MAKELTKTEEKSLNNLENNMKTQLAEFRKQNQDKGKEELQKELSELEEYLKGCYNSEIDDTLTSIRFHEEKTLVLKELIERLN